MRRVVCAMLIRGPVISKSLKLKCVRVHMVNRCRRVFVRVNACEFVQVRER